MGAKKYIHKFYRKFWRK